MVSKATIGIAGSLLLCLVPTHSLAAEDPNPTDTDLKWADFSELADPGEAWAPTFADENTVAWAVAARVATRLCESRRAGAGHFTGHKAQGRYGLKCSGPNFVWRDASAQEIASSGWPFSDINKVSWAQANRAAERLCASANQGFSGGHFNGHQLNGKYGLFCYGVGSQWFDATDAELAATGWGFPTPKLDDVLWAQAMRAATGYCQSKGFEGGFMNGHQAPNKYGVVCQKELRAAELPAAPSLKPPVRPWDERAADSPVVVVDRGQYDREGNRLRVCNVAGPWQLTQSDGLEATFMIENPKGYNDFYGKGSAHDSFDNQDMSGVVNGSVYDGNVSFKIMWNGYTEQKYQGYIDGSGHMHGTTKDLLKTRWKVSQTFVCK